MVNPFCSDDVSPNHNARVHVHTSVQVLVEETVEQ